MNRPMYEMLSSAAGRGSFHMPGHKGRGPFGALDPFPLDTTELPLTDDFYCPEGAIRRAQALYAQATGAGATLFLHNGSTAGIHAMLQLWAGEGDAVLLPRNAHLSAANACILGGLEPVWMPVTQRPDGYCFLAERTVLDAIEGHPEAKTLLLTRPDFYGGCLPLEKIVAAAHARGIRVVVDEAHGAHLPWLAGLPSAGACGADAWTQSVHKTLPGFTGSAVLHLRDAADESAALRILRREQTSSPSFLLMLSIDDARAFLEEADGRARLDRVAEAANALRSRLTGGPYRDAHASWADTGQRFDPTRLVLDTPQGGPALAKALQARGVDVEMTDPARAVFILSCMDEPADILRLADILAEIPAAQAPRPALPPRLPLPPRAMSLRRAALAPSEPVPASRAAGRVAAASAGLYPPGIPLVCPGEIIPQDVADRLAAASPRQRFGMEGDCLLCVR